jgi:hypothetical protein
MKNTRKNVLKYHYGAKLSSIFMILSPIFGIIVLLSVLGIIPKFPLTENMGNVTGILFFAVTIAIAAGCFYIINTTVHKIYNIIEFNNTVEATIVKCLPSKHNLTLVYRFYYKGIEQEHSIHVAKLLKSKKTYAVGTVHKVYVHSKQDKVISALGIFA